jgi:hypothetical protein
MTKWMIALIAAGALLGGCSKDGDKGADGKTAAAGESVGVAECDEYITKMEACMGKMPAEAKAVQEAAFKQARDGFKTGASTPEGKAALKTSCKAMVDALANNPACK